MAKARPILGLEVQAPTGNIARIIARVRLEEMYQWGRYVDSPSHERELHNLRIGAKRLRYTLEIFEDVLPEACKPVVKELEQIQEELGALHDSDVMIALLRLCLGGQDSPIPEQLHSDVKTQREKGKSLVAPELVAVVLDPAVAPSAGERYGLEQFLQRQEQLREKQYTSFRQHWYTLQARDFRREILDILDT